jgi:YggT family protein
VLYLILAVRGLVFVLFLVAAIVAVTHWAIKHGHLQPFGAFPRAIRRISDPLVKPLEQRMLKSGGNPVNAPYMLFWIALFGGLLTIGLVQWLVGFVLSLGASASAGPRGLAVFAVNVVFSILIFALFVRIISSWFGISPYSRPMRVVYGLTDWLLDPLRKVIPPLGPFDLSPIVAYLMLSLARWFLLSLM